jgi:hypothetical protein
MRSDLTWHARHYCYIRQKTLVFYVRTGTEMEHQLPKEVQTLKAFMKSLMREKPLMRLSERVKLNLYSVVCKSFPSDISV